MFCAHPLAPSHAALALTFSLKIGVLTENIFSAMLNDRLVAKGTVLEVFTIFLQVRSRCVLAKPCARRAPVQIRACAADTSGAGAAISSGG